MTVFSDQPCPCQSGKTYADCCRPLHSRKIAAATAEQLMRSRYTAYVLKNIDYIVATTVPSQQPLLKRTELQQWADDIRWTGLQIVQHKENLDKLHSQVEFNASFITAEGKRTHHELSLFVNINRCWYFVDPTVPLPGMKQPCVCGSGRKFKHCCGNYL
ncbi:YchJ family protein [Pasteurellaceae bacterium LIM206]|nr:YchJ family protein [Pasteurellaceae bacterium LIM206]